jgi:mRNA-degrading endonuclease RelE of RelBE toxin-antitoxin system
MKVQYGDAIRKALDEAPPHVAKAFVKQLKFLEQNLRHPSLRAKKYDEAKISGRPVNDDWRFYFAIIDDTYRILKVIRHPK